MAIIKLDIYSEALDMVTTVNVAFPIVRPNGETGKFKCLYLLHGLGDDCESWIESTAIEKYAQEYGIFVVMPDGGRSFYADEQTGKKYYKYIAKELPSIIEEKFNISDKREDRFIGGNSMGGYGAIKIALTERERYAAVFGLSSVANIENETFTQTLLPVFGNSIPDSADLFHLATQHNSDDVKPRIYMTIGKDDFMYKDNVRLSKHFAELGYDYEYIETPGDHEWKLWNTTIQNALLWMFK